VANVLERPHGQPSTADPAVQIAGNFAPIGERPPVRGLPVSGRIPPSISGIYARNGATPASTPSPGTTSSTALPQSCSPLHWSSVRSHPSGPNHGSETVLTGPLLLPLPQSSKQQHDPLPGVSSYLGHRHRPQR
jgi:hypothetical protein